MNTLSKFDALISKFEAPITEIACSLCILLSKHLPHPVETVDQENIGLDLAPGYKGLVFTIRPRPKYVMLGIAHAANLSDPTSLLQGKGKVHRHIKLYRVSELENPALEDLIHAAVEVARARFEN